MEERGDFIIGSKSKFTMIPNMIAHLGLSPMAFRLYFAYCETVGAYGEPDKTCFKTVRTLAKECGMSISSISRCRTELEGASLIVVEKSTDETKADTIYIMDVWELNETFKKSK